MPSGLYKGQNVQSRYMNNIGVNQQKTPNKMAQKGGMHLENSNQGPFNGNINPVIGMNGNKAVGNHMDILKKFRYNFHYWLRNCYQTDDMIQEIDPEVMQSNQQMYIDQQSALQYPYNKQNQGVRPGELYQAKKMGDYDPAKQNGKFFNNRNHNNQLDQNSKTIMNGTKEDMAKGSTYNENQSKSCKAGSQKHANLMNSQESINKCLTSPSNMNASQPLQTIKDVNQTGSPMPGSFPTAAQTAQLQNLPIPANKLKSDKYMVLQMGQQSDENQDNQLIQYLSNNALAVQHHPGAIQFQVSKQMLANLKKKFGNMKAIIPQKENPLDIIKDNNQAQEFMKQLNGRSSQQSSNQTKESFKDMNQQLNANNNEYQMLTPSAAQKPLPSLQASAQTDSRKKMQPPAQGAVDSDSKNSALFKNINQKTGAAPIIGGKTYSLNPLNNNTNLINCISGQVNIQQQAQQQQQQNQQQEIKLINSNLSTLKNSAESQGMYGSKSEINHIGNPKQLQQQQSFINQILDRSLQSRGVQETINSSNQMPQILGANRQSESSTAIAKIHNSQAHFEYGNQLQMSNPKLNNKNDTATKGQFQSNASIFNDGQKPQQQQSLNYTSIVSNTNTQNYVGKIAGNPVTPANYSYGNKSQTSCRIPNQLPNRMARMSNAQVNPMFPSAIGDSNEAGNIWKNGGSAANNRFNNSGNKAAKRGSQNRQTNLELHEKAAHDRKVELLQQDFKTDSRMGQNRLASLKGAPIINPVSGSQMGVGIAGSNSTACTASSANESNNIFEGSMGRNFGQKRNMFTQNKNFYGQTFNQKQTFMIDQKSSPNQQNPIAGSGQKQHRNSSSPSTMNNACQRQNNLQPPNANIIEHSHECDSDPKSLSHPDSTTQCLKRASAQAQDSSAPQIDASQIDSHKLKQSFTNNVGSGKQNSQKIISGGGAQNRNEQNQIRSLYFSSSKEEGLSKD